MNTYVLLLTNRNLIWNYNYVYIILSSVEMVYLLDYVLSVPVRNLPH